MTEKTQYTESQKEAAKRGFLFGLISGFIISLVFVSAGFYLSNMVG